MSQKLQTNVEKNIKALQSFMKVQGLDYFYISSFDPYLNEYVPMVNCHRFYVSAFTGSVAETLVPAEGKVKLYVDGRYHEQADMEADAKFVEVVKCGLGLHESLLTDIKKLSPKKLGLEADRVSLGFLRVLQKQTNVQSYLKNELEQVIEFGKLPPLKPIEFVEKKYRGADTADKLQTVFKEQKDQAYFLTGLDGIAWITNCRGYHLPFQSFFLARALMTRDKVFVFIDRDCPLTASAKNLTDVEFINLEYKDFPQKLKELQLKLNLKEIIFSPGLINAGDYLILKDVFTDKLLKEVEGGLVPYHSIKTPAEVTEIERSFALSDQAITKTIRWVRDSLNSGKSVSEIDFYNQANDFYKGVGAKDLSFNTISAIGANSSIVHFGSPSEKIKATDSDLMLLDSGAYYEGGFATDTTRAFFSNPQKGKPNPKQIEIYTLVLKGLIQAMTAIVPEGTLGVVIDGLARDPILRKGYNYAHGTGHGVGINVHEDGARFNSRSTLPIKPGQLVSIEPGIYLPGFGGVRLENIILVEAHPEFQGMVKFRSVVYVGFDNTLIDRTILTKDETTYLDWYHGECAKRGTTI